MDLEAKETATNAGTFSSNGALRFLGTSFGNVGDLNFNIGPDVHTPNDTILIVNGDYYYLLTTSESIFNSQTNANIDITYIETNDPQLQSAIAADGGAKFCRAANPNSRPGDTSWGIIPSGSTQRSCGCNSGGWSGYGVYYGGTQNGQQTQCSGFGGQFAGFKSNGAQKGGLSTGHDTEIYIKNTTETDDNTIHLSVDLKGIEDFFGAASISISYIDQDAHSEYVSIQCHVANTPDPLEILSIGISTMDFPGPVSTDNVPALYTLEDSLHRFVDFYDPMASQTEQLAPRATALDP